MTITGFSNRRDLVTKLGEIKKKGDNSPVIVSLPDGQGDLEVYPASLRRGERGGYFLAGNFNNRNALFVLGASSLKAMARYPGRDIARFSDFVIRKCRITRSVAQQLREDFPFCAPVGRQNGNISIAFGDVLGLSCKAQMLAFSGKADLIFSRQCIRQLKELEFQPEDAMDAVTWAIFQEGYEDGFAAEACQLSTPEELEEMLDAGFTRFSIEPAERCPFWLRDAPKHRLLEEMFDLPWIELRDKFELMFHRYKGMRIDLPAPEKPGQEPDKEPLVIAPNEQEVLAAIRIFIATIHQIVAMENVLTARHCRDQVTLEVSFSRSKENLSAFEHFFVINELLRHDIQPDYIAPGEITREHRLVAFHNGGYGLSGPADKIRHIWKDAIAIKQHGVFPDISYITAMKCLVHINPDMFRTVWETSRNGLEEARKGKETDVKIQYIPSAAEFSDDELPELFQNDHTDAFLKLTKGVVMTARDEQGNRYLRQSIYDFLQKHESEYVRALLTVYHSWAGAWERKIRKLESDRVKKDSVS